MGITSHCGLAKSHSLSLRPVNNHPIPDKLLDPSNRHPASKKQRKRHFNFHPIRLGLPPTPQPKSYTFYLVSIPNQTRLA